MTGTNNHKHTAQGYFVSSITEVESDQNNKSNGIAAVNGNRCYSGVEQNDGMDIALPRQKTSHSGSIIVSDQIDVMEYEHYLHHCGIVLNHEQSTGMADAAGNVVVMGRDPENSGPLISQRRDYDSAGILPNSRSTCMKNNNSGGVISRCQEIDSSDNKYVQEKTFLNPRSELINNNLLHASELPKFRGSFDSMKAREMSVNNGGVKYVLCPAYFPTDGQCSSWLSLNSQGNSDNINGYNNREVETTRRYSHEQPTMSAALLNAAPIQIAEDEQRRAHKKKKSWTKDEHALFLEGLRKHGTGKWKRISREYVTTKSYRQIASHAQKYFKRGETPIEKRPRRSMHDVRLASHEQHFNNS